MAKPITVDFVSDVSCPWCFVGLGGLTQALDRLGDLVEVDIKFHPFELNPAMGPDGQNIVEHIAQKYGRTPEQAAAGRETLRERGAAAGVVIDTNDQRRIYNTFDAHRLLYWAGLGTHQPALKRALLQAYFTEGRNPSDHDVLVDVARQVGLDGTAAREVLTSGRYADEVRAAEREWQSVGITSVPAIILDRKYLISGGQPAEVFEQALRQLATAA
jgi:predicted DsbA family dithiol-disulfide isomerase